MRIIFITFFILAFQYLSAQQAMVKGTILDSLSLSPVDHATISLIHKQASFFTARIFSNKDGLFEFTKLKAGSYLLDTKKCNCTILFRFYTKRSKVRYFSVNV